MEFCSLYHTTKNKGLSKLRAYANEYKYVAQLMESVCNRVGNIEGRGEFLLPYPNFEVTFIVSSANATSLDKS